MQAVPKYEISGDRFFAGGVDLLDAARKYGTPLYVVNGERIRYKYQVLKAAFEEAYPDAKICYSYKANANLAICALLKKEGAGAAVASLGGLLAASKVGVDAGSIVFDGPSKSDEELAKAVELGVGVINAESNDELRILNEIGKSQARMVTAGIRVNLGLSVKTHAKLATSRPGDKFGIDVRETFRVFKLSKQLTHLALHGLHSHIGSQILDPRYFREQARRLATLIRTLRRKFGASIRLVNLGGGFGLPYGRRDKPFPIQECARTVARIFKEECEAFGLDLPTLILEPGRFIVGDSALLLTKVNYVKKVGPTNWALVDAGMNDFMRPALYGAHHEIVTVNKASLPRSRRYNIGGPICESSDVFGENRGLPHLERGDVLAIEDVGAYGICMASEYMSRPVPAMVIVDEGRATIIRRRGTSEGLFSSDILE